MLLFFFSLLFSSLQAVSAAAFPSDCSEGDRLIDEAAASILQQEEEEEKRKKEFGSPREEKIERDETSGANEEEGENEGEYETNVKKASEEKRRREGVAGGGEQERQACPQKPLKNILPGEVFNLSLQEVFLVLFHDFSHAKNPFHRSVLSSLSSSHNNIQKETT